MNRIELSPELANLLKNKPSKNKHKYYSTYKIELKPSNNLKKRLNKLFGFNRLLYNNLVNLYNINHLLLINTLYEIITETCKNKNKISKYIIEGRLYENLVKILLTKKEFKKMASEIPTSMVRETCKIFIRAILDKFKKTKYDNTNKLVNYINKKTDGSSILYNLNRSYGLLKEYKKKQNIEYNKILSLKDGSNRFLTDVELMILKYDGREKYIKSTEEEYEEITNKIIKIYSDLNENLEMLLDFLKKSKLDHMRKKEVSFIKIYYPHDKYKYKPGNKTIHIPKFGRINIGDKKIEGKISYVIIYKKVIKGKEKYYISIQTTNNKIDKCKYGEAIVVISNKHVTISDGKTFTSTKRMDKNWYTMKYTKDKYKLYKGKYKREMYNKYIKHFSKFRRSLKSQAELIANYISSNFTKVKVFTDFENVKYKDPYKMNFGKEIEKLLYKKIERNAEKYYLEYNFLGSIAKDDIKEDYKCCLNRDNIHYFKDNLYYCKKCGTVFKTGSFKGIKSILLHISYFGGCHIKSYKVEHSGDHKIILTDNQGRLTEIPIEPDKKDNTKIQYKRLSKEELLKIKDPSNLSHTDKERWESLKFLDLRERLDEHMSFMYKKKRIRRRLDSWKFWSSTKFDDYPC